MSNKKLSGMTMVLTSLLVIGCNQAPSTSVATQPSPSSSSEGEQNIPLNIDELKKSFPIKGFTSKSLTGNTNITFNTPGQNFKFNQSDYLYGFGFDNNKVYQIEIKSSTGENVYMYMWKLIQGVWVPQNRWVKSGDEVKFRGGSIDFTHILLWPSCSINPASASAKIYEVAENSPVKVRSADPYNRYIAYDPGITVQELKGGNASHKLSPAEIIYYSSKENNINPVLVLSKLQDEQSLITQDKSSGDFERRLLRACGYGALDSGDIPKWYGFYPQLVSTSLKFSNLRNGTFESAYKTFTTGSGKYENFINNLYPNYAAKMNQSASTNYSRNPSSSGYFNDFRNISVNNIQSFLENYSGALKEKDLFRQAPVNNSVAY